MADSDERPIIRWDAPVLAPKDGASILAGILLPGGNGDVSFQHLRFEVQPNGSDLPQYAVAALAVQSLRLSDCEFQHEGARGSGGAVYFLGRSGAEPPALGFDRCFLTRGPAGIEVHDRSLVKAVQCAFGPHDVLFHWQESTVPAVPNPDRLLANLEHCTALMRDGAIFQLDSNVAGTIRAGNCVFAGGTERSEPGDVMLVQQLGTRGKVVLAGPESGDWRNVYHHLTFWSDAAGKAQRVADCQRMQFPFRDSKAVEPAFSPWQHAQPLTLLPDKLAFALQTGFASLRALPKHDELVGVQHCTWDGDIYPQPLPVVQEETPAAIANRRVVDPSFAADAMLPPLTYRTLENAISEAKSGDTIVIRHTGVLPVRPMEWTRPDQRLTIQPDGSNRPILELEAETVKPQTAMFTLFSGSVTFKDLQFRLTVNSARDTKWLGVVLLAGAGECQFQHCAATLDEGNGTQIALALLTADVDSMANLADKPPPRVRIENSFVRGKGDLLMLKPSRPFHLEVTNCLLGLDGSLATVFGQSKENTFAAQGEIICRRVTTYLNDCWLDLRANEEDRKMAGFSPTLIKCEECKFIAAINRPFIHAVGIDGEKLLNHVFTWENRSNLYANYGQMLDVELPATNMMMPMMPLNAKKWRDVTLESEDSFVEVQIMHKPSAERPWAKMQPGDFTAKRMDMKKTDINPNDFGVNFSDLLIPDDDSPPSSTREE
jgi:hypothetical protein